MKCTECKTFKKAENCQQCYVNEKRRTARMKEIVFAAMNDNRKMVELSRLLMEESA